MIQRLQTIYLVAIILIVSTLCGLNIIHATVADATGSTEYLLNLFYFTIKHNAAITETHLQWGLILIAAIIIGLAIFAIMSFKNRAKQMLFCKINFLAMIALIAAVTAKTYSYIPGFNFTMLMLPSIFSISFLIFMLYLNWRALALIQKDDELIKSADRIR